MLREEPSPCPPPKWPRLGLIFAQRAAIRTAGSSKAPRTPTKEPVSYFEEPESLQLMPTQKLTQQSPQPPKLTPPPLLAAASEVDDVREEHPWPKLMPSRPKWSPKPMPMPMAAAHHHNTNLTIIAETPEHGDGVAPFRAEAAAASADAAAAKAAAARAEAAAARAQAAVATAVRRLAAVAAATHANQSPPPEMSPPPLAAASGKQNGPKGRGSVSAELPVGDVHEEKETAGPLR